MSPHGVPPDDEATMPAVDHRAPPAIVSAHRVSKEFVASDGRPFLALDDVSLALLEGEIVALLGTSGSGKSTLLRLLAGLLEPTGGDVTYRGEPVTGPNPGVSMVFQSFALLPWLTVQKNVELGLEARGVAPAARAERAVDAIDLIGLDGFEQAFPKELSGGMRQRVGLARALVVEPDALLMDEPFSALDVLTAENLRGELLRLWDDSQFPTRAILLVTHNIEEAVLLADRAVVLSAGPGRVKGEVRIDLPRPRDPRTESFAAVTDEIYGLLTGPGLARAEASVVRGAPGGATDDTGSAAPDDAREPAFPLHDTPLPDASVGGLRGLLEVLIPRGGRDDISALASRLNFSADALLPLLEAAQLLGLASVADADVDLTEAGRDLAVADIQVAKRLFARAAVERAPLVRAIYRSLEAAHHQRLSAEFFLDLLRASYADDEARRQLSTAIDWGRYAELFDYDAGAGHLTLDPTGLGY